MEWLANASLNNIVHGSDKNLWGEKDPFAIFDALLQRQSGMETLSNQFLQTGIDHYQNKNYEEAVKSFKASIGISPNSTYNADTTTYLAQTYLKLEETEKAFDAYRQAIVRNPDRDDLRTALGQLYFAEGRYAEAVEQYRGAVRVNPSATNRYSFGEALLKVENYTEADYQFREVKRLEPTSHVGDYGLGKLHAQTGSFDTAIAHFESALERQPDFYDALAEIGYAYADMGEIAKAREVEERLLEVDEGLAGTLGFTIDRKEPPRITFAFSTSSFQYTMSKGSPVSAMDEYLKNAGAELSVSMQFVFSKEMDPASIENRFNWTLSRASNANIAETYNFGDAIPSTEIDLAPYPNYVLYDKDSRTATVGFFIRQNQTADGTLDPSHIVFKFAGEDVHGVSMDPDGDEYSGFSRTA